jgi:hypothetical protein
LDKNQSNERLTHRGLSERKKQSGDRSLGETVRHQLNGPSATEYPKMESKKEKHTS